VSSLQHERKLFTNLARKNNQRKSKYKRITRSMPTKKKQLQQYQVEKILQKRNIILFYQCNNVNKKEWELVKKGLLSTLPGVYNTRISACADLPSCKQQSKVSETTDAQLGTDPLLPFVTLLVKNRLGHRCATLVGLDAEQRGGSMARGSLAAPGHRGGGHRRGTEDSISRSSLDWQWKKQAKRSLLLFAGNTCKSSRKKSIEENHWSNLFQGPTLLFACNSHHQMVAGYNAIAKNTNWHSSISLLGGMYYGKVMTHLDFTKLCKLDQGVYAILTSSFAENVELLLNQRLSFYQSRLLFYLDCHAVHLRSIEEKKDKSTCNLSS
jgi:hypothetical protein